MTSTRQQSRIDDLNGLLNGYTELRGIVLKSLRSLDLSKEEFDALMQKNLELDAKQREIEDEIETLEHE